MTELHHLNELEVPSLQSRKYTDGDYVVGKLVYNFGTTKEIEKLFVGIIVKCKRCKRKLQYEINFIRKQSVVSADGEVMHYFIFPHITDEWFLDRK